MQCQLPAPFQLRGASRRRSCSGCSQPRPSDRWVGERESASFEAARPGGKFLALQRRCVPLHCCPVTCQFGAQNGSKGNCQEFWLQKLPCKQSVRVHLSIWEDSCDLSSSSAIQVLQLCTYVPYVVTAWNAGMQPVLGCLRLSDSCRGSKRITSMSFLPAQKYLRGFSCITTSSQRAAGKAVQLCCRALIQLMLSSHATCISTGDCPRACPGCPVPQSTSPFHFWNVLQLLQPHKLKTTIYSSNFKCSCCCDLFFVLLFNCSARARQCACFLKDSKCCSTTCL